MDSEHVIIYYDAVRKAYDQHDHPHTKISDFETRVCGMEIMFGHEDGGFVYKIVDERKFQLAKLKHGF